MSTPPQSKIRKVRVWLTEKGKAIDTKSKAMYEKPVTSADLTQPFNFDVYADFISDGATKNKVAEFSFNYTGTIPPTDTNNKKPVAKAGNDQTVKPKDTVTLDGSQSSDPEDGTKLKKYEWTQISGSQKVNLVFNSSIPTATFVAPELGDIDQPPPVPPPTEGTLLYDSNIHGKWNNGVKRTVKGTEGNQSPNGKGLHTAASGSPRLIIDGNGIAHLEADPGHGRIYVKATNYNARLEFDFMFEDANIDNISFKLRSRHNMGGDCSNRFGGFGGAIDRIGGSIDFKTESCHNNHENSIDGTLPKPISQGQWYRLAISVYDAPDKKQVNLKAEIDYKDGQGWKHALTGVHKNPQAYYIDEPKFMEDSYFWLRINNEKTGRVAFKDVKLTKIDNKLSSQQEILFTKAAELLPASPQPTSSDEYDDEDQELMTTTTTTPPNSETYTFRLKVTDTKGATATDDVNVVIVPS